MSFISRAFRGRPRDEAPAGRLPPGQYLITDFPVLSAGPTPRTPFTDWSFSITGEIDKPRRWTWDEFRKLPTETITQAHSLRHQVEQVRHRLERRQRRHAPGGCEYVRRVRDGLL